MSNMKNVFDNLHYYCILMDFNTEKPKYVDIMKFFEEDVLFECLNKYKSITNYEQLCRWVKLILKDCFMSKTEYEINISPVVKNDVKSKISIWDQVAPNVTIIADIINQGCGLGFEKTPIKPEKLIIPIEETI